MIYIFWKNRIKNQTDESRVQILCIETFMFSTSYVYKKQLKVKVKYIEQFIYSSQETLVVMVKRHHCKIK